MLALGYFCFKCRQFWTNEDVNEIIEEELQELRERKADRGEGCAQT
jgi:hypothetical protein